MNHKDRHGIYSIKELEVLSGIKAHTIRIWEQRYHILKPGRTDTNIRYYDEADLKHLLNVSLLNKNGYKISRLAMMPEQELKDTVLAMRESNHEFENQIDSLILAMIEFNEEGVERILSSNTIRLGFESCFYNIAFPLLQRIGLLWQTAAIHPAQEHFISNLIRQKIIVAIDSQINPGKENTKKCLLFLPDKELHELTLLFTNFILRSRGVHTLYLGASVPFDDVIAAFDDYGPDYIISVCIAHPVKNHLQQFISKLSSAFPGTPILTSGRQILINKIQIPSNVTVMETIPDSINYIDKNIALR